MFTIALDGPAGAGKGTICRELAKRFELAYLDTGLLYRAVAAKVIDSGCSPLQAAQSLKMSDLNSPKLWIPMIASKASEISTLADVRAALLPFQIGFAIDDENTHSVVGKEKPKGRIIDGRDIGTVVCPNAEIKFFITASEAVRAKRRFDELIKRGIETTLSDVLHNLQNRDKSDSTREHAPLSIAADAVVVDTTDMSVTQAIGAVVGHVLARLSDLSDSQYHPIKTYTSSLT